NSQPRPSCSRPMGLCLSTKLAASCICLVQWPVLLFLTTRHLWKVPAQAALPKQERPTVLEGRLVHPSSHASQLWEPTSSCRARLVARHVVPSSCRCLGRALPARQQHMARGPAGERGSVQPLQQGPGLSTVGEGKWSGGRWRYQLCSARTGPHCPGALCA
uniref:Uncharacterized protein n=1 Tax=Crocodylus porosus TaxID=8502 RepID=A0A7M4F4P1_CROPO